MRMIPLAPLLAVLAVTAAAPDTRAAGRGCAGGKGSVIARSEAAVVRLETRHDEDEFAPYIWRGCLRSRGRYVRIGDGYVGFRRSTYHYTGGSGQSAEVVDLRSGPTPTDHPPGTSTR